MKKISSLQRSLNRSARACLPLLVSIAVALVIGLAFAGRAPNAPFGGCVSINPGSPPPNLGPVTVKATAGILVPTDYATLKAAFDAINAGTHQGQITVWILGDTVETASAVLNASGTGAAAYNALLMLPSATRTISGNLAAPLVDFNGSDCVTIDGVGTGGNSLTISNTNTSNTAGTSTIRFINGAQSDTVKNARVFGSSRVPVGTAGGTLLFHTTNTGFGNGLNTIFNNDIGPASVNYPSKAISAVGTTTNTSTINNNNLIDGNRIGDFFGDGTISTSGIDIRAGNRGWTVSNNRLYQKVAHVFTAVGLSYAGVTIAGTSDVNGDFHTISGNIIGFGNFLGTATTVISGSDSTFRGISIVSASTATPTIIQGNIVSGIDFSTAFAGNFSGAAGFVGIGDPFIADFRAAGLCNISGNTIGSLDGSSTIVVRPQTGVLGWTVYGIRGRTVPSVISGNQIGAISITSTAANIGFQAIHVENIGGGSIVTVINNMVGGSGPGGAIFDAATGGYEMEGMLEPNCDTTTTGNLVRNISSNQNGAFGTYGINVAANGTVASNISQNVIHSLTGSFVKGIQAQLALQANRIERNFIHSLNSPGTNSSIFGMYLPGSANIVVANNMIQLGFDAAGNPITTPRDMEGIQDQNSGTREYYFNSIFIGGSVTNANNDTMAFANFSSGTRIFKNNIFWNARSSASGSAKNYAIYVFGTVTGLTSDYNDLYATGTNGYVGRISPNGDQLTLANWQAATVQDAHTISLNPQ